MNFVAKGAGIAAGVTSIGATQQAGRHAQYAHERAADSELDAARDREIERRRRLVAALASQNAEAGAMGAAPGIGSVRAVALADARRKSYESLADAAGTGRRTLMLRSAGQQAAKQAKYQGQITALNTFSQALG